MHIERFDPETDQQQLRTCFEIRAAARPYDDPSLPPQSFAAFTARWTHGSGNPRQAWLARDNTGEPVGCYLLMLPERENPTMAWCAPTIAPDSRRAGFGTELLAHCARQARLAGRVRLAADVTDDSAGAAFAAAIGATSGIAEVFRVLSADSGLRSRLPSLRAEAQSHAAGYTLVSWLGACPEEHLAGVVRLSGAMADAPRDAAVDPEMWDADRIRTVEAVGVASGWQYYAVAARHDATGELAAVTQIGTDPGVPGWAFQSLTAVLPEHRGHRLGLLTKAAMLDLLLDREPDVGSIVTSNAGPNRHMIAINARLGFEACSVRRSWELDVTSAP